MKKRKVRIFRERLFLAYLILAFSLSLTFIAWHWAKEHVDFKAKTEFEHEKEEMLSLLNERLQVYVSALHGVQAFFAGSHRVDRDEFHDYVNNLDIKRLYPGITAIRYIQKVGAREKEKFIQEVRSDKSVRSEGYPDFKIHPETNRDEFYAVKYVEPYLGNEAMLGLDLGWEPIRRSALERARDSGEPAATESITLVTDTGREPSFLVELPVYGNGAPISTVEERRLALKGFVDIAIRSRDLFAFLSSAKIFPADIDFEIYDSPTVSQEHLLFDRCGIPNVPNPDFHPRFISQERFPFANHTWNVFFYALPSFRVGTFGEALPHKEGFVGILTRFALGMYEEEFPPRVLIVGFLISGLLFALFYFQSRLHERVRKLVRRLTDAVRENQERLQAILDYSPACIYVIDLEGRFLLVNRHCEEIFRCKASKIIGKTLCDFIQKEYADRIRANDLKVLQAKKPMEFEEEFPHEDGLHYAFTVKFPLLDARGEPYALCGISTDVTQRKVAEQARLATQSMLAAILHISEDAIISVNQNQEIILFNKGAEKVFGYTSEEAAGKPLELLIPERCREIHKQHFAEFWRSPEMIRSMKNRTRDIFGLRKDGTEFPVEISISKIKIDGEWVFTAYVRDITARRKSETQIQRQTEQLETVSQAMTSFLSTGDWHEASAILLRAAVKLTASEYGFVAAVVEGPTIRVFAHEGIVWDKVINQEFYRQAMETYKKQGYLEFNKMNSLYGHVITEGKAVIANDPASDPRRYGLPPGHPPLKHFLGVPALKGAEVVGMIAVANRPGGYTGEEQGQLEILSGAMSVLYDSYRRQERETTLADQLRQSVKMEAVGRLAGGVAHDFNNMLTAIVGYAEILLDRLRPGDPLRHGVEEIKKAADRSSSLTRQLLAFGRKQILQLRVLDLNQVIREMEGMLKRVIGEDIELMTTFEKDLGSVKADPSQIEQVVLNLAVNSREAMRRGGKLIIETKNMAIDEEAAKRYVDAKAGTYVRLSVADTGKGMDEKIKAHIFEPFFTTKEKGSGLGLSTVYGIAKQCEGFIDVESAPGRGTVMQIYFPRTKEKAEKREGVPEVKTMAGTETVLLVEDDEMVRQLAMESLRMKGYRVLEASNGGEALLICERHADPIPLLLTDVVMPQMSGRQLVERLHSQHPEMKVLYMSGYTDDAILQHGVLEAGVNFIPKPFTPTTLLRKVREVLDSSK